MHTTFTRRIGFASFLIAAALLLTNAATGVVIADEITPTPIDSPHAVLRGDYTNSRLRFERDKVGHVAWLGGSITEMNGYRPMLMRWLQQRYPDTKFTFTSAGIGSTCSTTGAMRLGHDVLADGPVDLFFVEFAVNDDQDAHHTRDECIRGLEGIIRQVRRHNPNADIVVTYFVNEGMLATTQKGDTPLTVEAHDAVAKHYNVSSSNVGAELADRIKAGTMDWKTYGGVHPHPAGNAVAAGMAAGILNKAWSEPLPADAKPTAHPMPAAPLDPLCYDHGRFIDPATASVKSGWTLHVPDWKSIKGSKRERFTSIPMLEATTPGAELTLKFTGHAVGAYVVAGPDAGMIESSVDGGPFTTTDLYHRFSGGLHYPRTVMFATDLPAGDHTVVLRVAATHNDKSHGAAARVMQFVAN
ncbi:MAG: SGNH/GDSL hydrolase family protein [Phycisphaera sp.]|nr:SGNH/GDSL hydrolase family protein [Phycisphaera sp.]